MLRKIITEEADMDDRIECVHCGEFNAVVTGGFSGDVWMTGSNYCGVDITNYECPDCGAVWSD